MEIDPPTGHSRPSVRPDAEAILGQEQFPAPPTQPIRGRLIGQRLGEFALLSLIGVGGMAEVYRAEDTALGREVAVKVLPVELAFDDSYVGRFQREAHIVARLDHPHVIPIYAFGEAHGLLYLVMPLMPDSLHMHLREGRPMIFDEAARITLEVASALAAAHEAGIVHRDVKPENILLTTTGTALLSDFGLAREITVSPHTIPRPTLASSGFPVGTPYYMAPEQLRGEAIDQRADIYALGVVLYEMLTGALPFVGDTPYQIAAQALTREAPPPSQKNPAVWPALDQVVLTALAKDPNDRYPDAPAFVAALRQAMASKTPPIPGRGSRSSAPTLPSVLFGAVAVGQPQRARPSYLRLWAPLAGVAIIALLLVALGSGLGWLPGGNTGSLGARPGVSAPDVGSHSTSGDVGTPGAPTGVASPGAGSTVTPLVSATPGKHPGATPTTVPGATPTSIPGATPTATSIPGATPTPTTVASPLLTFSPTPWVLQSGGPGGKTCSGTQIITNTGNQTVGWSWQGPPQGNIQFQVNGGGNMPWPSDTSPGIAPQGQDVLSATTQCGRQPQSYTITVTDTLGYSYTFTFQVPQRAG